MQRCGEVDIGIVMTVILAILIVTIMLFYAGKTLGLG